MLNNYYFEDENSPKLSFGKKGFKEEVCDYLKAEYNYSLQEAIKDTGLSEEDLESLYEESMEGAEFAELIMEESKRMKSNYFNIILSGGRNII